MSPIATSRWQVGGEWIDLDSGLAIPPTDPPTAGFFFTVQGGGNDARNGNSAYNKDGLYNRIAQAMGRENEAWPLGGRHKFFDSGGNGIAASVNNHLIDTPSCTDPYPLYCFKSYTTAAVNARLNAVTEPEVWVWEQEYYAGNNQAGWNAYNNNYATLKGLRDAHANGHLVELCMVSSNAEERQTPGYFASANAAVADSWGADAYNAKQGSPYSVSTLFDAQYAAWQQMLTVNPSVKWIISEYGISRYKTLPGTLYSGQERLDYLVSHIDYLIDRGCSGLTFWAVDNSNNAAIKDWSVDKDTPQDAVFAAGLADLIEQYPVPAIA